MADDDLRAQINQVHAHVLRLGEQLNVMTDIMLSLARTEERLASIVEHNQRQDVSIDENKKEIASVRQALEGPEGVHAKVAALLGKVGLAIVVGVYVINFYFTTLRGE